jgi:hypothetical protein
MNDGFIEKRKNPAQVMPWPGYIFKSLIETDLQIRLRKVKTLSSINSVRINQ